MVQQWEQVHFLNITDGPVALGRRADLMEDSPWRETRKSESHSPFDPTG